ncbi:MAG: FecR domain-containing protein [Deltaproteobacteria bacterium]|nr:FecR domain-containing protein [Deltaproteobacteria bacterium]
MSLRDHIPVEQLDDERLTNIERKLVVHVSDMAAPPARASRRLLAFAGVAFAVGAAAGIGWKLHAPAAPVVTPEVAQTFAIEAKGERQSVELGDATIASAPETRVAVSRTSHETIITMTRGTLDLSITHRADRRFVIRAGDTEIEDVGTVFSVSFDGASHVGVRVTEGEVAVTRQRKREQITAGHEWSSDGLVAIAEVKPAVVAVAAAPVAVTPAPDVSLREHVAMAPPAPAVHAHPHAAHVADAPPVLGEPVAHAPVPADPYVDLQQAIRKQPIELDPHIDGKTDASAQIAVLKKQAYAPPPLGPEASHALYTIAVLLHRPLGQDAEALHTLDMYRRRFSGGLEKSAALWLRVRILCGHAIDDECRKAAYTYQHEVPSGPAADLAIRITNAQ